MGCCAVDQVQQQQQQQPHRGSFTHRIRFSGSSSSVIAAVCGAAPQPLCSVMRKLTAFDVSDEDCLALNNGTGKPCSWFALAAA